MSKILIVDDEPSVRLTLAEFLRQDGHEVLTAEGADEALANLRGRSVDLMVTDILLPGLSGLELLARIREVAPETVVVMMTGAPSVESAAESVRRGAADYLTKPVSKLDIKRAAGSALQMKALADTRRRLESLNREYQLRLEREVADRTRSLNESRQFLVDLVEHSGALVFAKDAQGRYELVNRQWELVTGRSRDAVLGRTDFEIFSEGDARLFHEADTIVMSGRKAIEVEEYLLGPEGRRVFLSVKFPMLSASGEVRGLCGMSTEITERRRMENALRSSEAELRRAQSVAHVGSWTMDMQTRALRCSEETCRIYGVAPGTAESARVFEDKAHPADLLYLQDAWEGSANGKPLEVEHRIVVDGNTRWVRLKAEIEAGADGRPVTALGTVQDITAYKQVESRFLRAQRLESIGSLAGGLAHDLNNILAPILIAGPLLRGSITDADDVAVLDLMEGCARRGAELIRQLLAFSRGSEGRQVAVQLRYLVRETLSILKETLPRTISVDHSVEEDLWLVLGDPTQLQQVIMNLCVNARDAMPEGGDLRVDVRKLELQAPLACMPPDTELGRFLKVQVSDTGHGMSQEVLDRVFEPFFTTKEVGKGTGLGLTTVLAIVKGHGGFMDVRSEPGRGTTFDIYLRALPVAPLAEPVDGTSPLPRGRGEMVLLVDDEPGVRRILGSLLERQGFKVIGVRDGLEAVKVFESRSGDIRLVLSDLMMPGMDGLQLAEALLNRPSKPQMVVVTGVLEWEESADKIARLRALGVRHILRKPCDPRELLTAVAGSLARPGPGAP